MELDLHGVVGKGIGHLKQGGIPHGIPEHLLKEIFSEEMPQDFLEKTEKALKFHMSGMRVFFLTGAESPSKDRLAVFLLTAMLGLTGKVIRFVNATSMSDEPLRGVVAIMAADQAKGIQALKVSALLRDHVSNGRAVIIGGDSMKRIEEALGATIIDYLSHLAVEIKAPVEREVIPEI